jgi:hypothetical protein
MKTSIDRILTTHVGSLPADFGPIHPAIGWLKMKSLSEGAALASQRLWARAGSAA